MDIRPCGGERSPSDTKRPAAICRDCQHRIAWQIGADRTLALYPLAQYVGQRLQCTNKVKA
jgi:hypothetical protein